MIARSALAVLFAVSLAAHAQQYRWIDDKGRTQFGDNPPPSAKKVEKLGGAKPAAEEASSQQVPYELQRAQKDFPVTLFTAPICKQPCTQAREVLNKRGIPFTEVQVWNEETFTQLKTAASSENVPALVVGRSAYAGFDQSRYDTMLDLAGYPKPGVLPARKQDAPPVPEGYEPPPSAVEPVKPEPSQASPGPYDASGLKSNEKPRPRLYDPSVLPSNEKPKPRIYQLPGESTK